jgi:hypothetical protein
MDLRLSLPDFDNESMTVVETKPNKAQTWLAELPILNLAQTSHTMFRSLSALNRMDIDEKSRLRLMEVYRESVARVCTKLKDEYVGQPLPLGDRAKVAADRARDFQVEMAYGYKRVLVDTLSSNRVRPSSRAMASLSLVIQRAMRYLAEVLVRSYQCYCTIPAGTWREIHQLYSLADAYGVATAPVPDALNTAVPESSVDLVYKQALLVDFADPYHLPSRMVALIQHYLNRWATLGKLVPGSQPPGKNCQFLIDLENDKAGELFVPTEATLIPAERYRLLDTTELARKIHSQLSKLQKGQKPAPHGLHADFFESDLMQDLLKRLISSWGINPKRTFSRTERSGASVDVAIGLRAISYWLNGGTEFVPSSEFVGPMPQLKAQVGGRYATVEEAMNDGVAEQAGVIPNEHPDFVYAPWELVDESAGGMFIRSRRVSGQQARVGDLVAIRAPDGRTWEISAIRWLKSTDDGAIEIGMKRISPVAQAIVYKTFDEDHRESEFLPAIHVPELKALHQKAGMIAYKGTFRPDRELFYDDGYRLTRIRAIKLVESTAHFDHFEYIPV